jgi:hypothetical protein
MKVRDLMLLGVLVGSASAFTFKAPAAYGAEAIMQAAGGAPSDDADAKKGEKKKGKKGDKKKGEGKEEKSDK